MNFKKYPVRFIDPTATNSLNVAYCQSCERYEVIYTRGDGTQREMVYSDFFDEFKTLAVRELRELRNSDVMAAIFGFWLELAFWEERS